MFYVSTWTIKRNVKDLAKSEVYAVWCEMQFCQTCRSRFSSQYFPINALTWSSLSPSFITRIRKMSREDKVLLTFLPTKNILNQFAYHVQMIKRCYRSAQLLYLLLESMTKAMIAHTHSRLLCLLFANLRSTAANCSQHHCGFRSIDLRFGTPGHFSEKNVQMKIWYDLIKI